MPLDTLTLTAVVDELQALAGARIDKIHQPGKDELVLSLRGADGTARLLLSANAARPRLHLLERGRENPAAPPMFCMLLRKHLAGGRLRSVTQAPMERVVRLDFDTLDELGSPARRALVLEAMGRHSNLILLDGEERILAALRRVDAEMSERRQVLPGLFYRLPPPQEKRALTETDGPALRALLCAAPPEARASDWLLDCFSISPLLSRELAFRAGGAADARLCGIAAGALEREWELLRRRVGESAFEPVLLLREGKPVDFFCMPVLQYGPGTALRRMPSFSALLEDFYEARDLRERMRLRGAELYRAAASARERAARRQAVRERELAAARERETLRRRGDLIKANLYRMERGMSALCTEDFFAPDGGEVTVPLDPLLSPQQNAARYYKLYGKAKRAEEYLAAEMERGAAELLYLDSVLEALSRAERESDLRELRQELAQGGYLREKRESGAGEQKKARGKPREKQGKPAAAAPMSFRSTAGLPILAGRNNTQNDLLTLKTARKDEWWFHARNMPGAHVILRTGGAAADEQSMHEAAMLAAYYSKGREGQNVPVDCTLVRHVKKPPGARPGMVVYTDYRTLYATPDAAAASRLSDG